MGVTQVTSFGEAEMAMDILRNALVILCNDSHIFSVTISVHH